MKYKSVLILICLVVLSCVLCGCQKMPPKEGVSNESVQGSIEAEESPVNSIDCSLIDEVSDFSDGVAWVTDSRNGGEDKYLIDENGIIQFTLDETPYKEISHYCQGGAIAYSGPKKQHYTNNVESVSIVDKSGKPIWTIEEDGKNKGEAIYGNDALEDVYAIRVSDELWHGYLIVAFEIDTFEYAGVICGVVDTSGKWIIEPPTLDKAPVQKELGYYETPLENIYYEDYDLRINRQAVLVYRTAEVLPCEGLLYDHDGFIYGSKDINEIHDEEYAIAHHNRVYEGYGEFVDENGNVVLDINNLSSSIAKSAFDAAHPDESFAYSEYCIVSLSNKGGGRYLTVIDLNGNQMFDPKKYDARGELSETAFYYQPDKDADGYYLTVNGGKLGSVTGLNGTRFSEKRAWIKADGVWRCIDESGEYAF